MSSSKLSRDQTSNPTSSTNPTPKGRIHRSSKQKVENSNFEENLPPEVSMADNRTMAQLLQAPTEGYKDAIFILEIAATNFKLKHGLINRVQNKQFFGHDKEDQHAHIRYFNKITSTMRVPNFFPPLKMTNLRNEITRFHQRFDESFAKAWDLFNDLLRACPHHRFSELHQLDTFYNALNVNDQDSLNSAAAISSDVAELKDMVRALLLDKKNQYSAPTPSPTPAPIKAIEPNCVTCGGTHAYQNCPTTIGNVYQDNIQEPQVNQPLAYQAPAYPTPVSQTQSVSQTDFERYIKANDAVLRNIQSQGQSTQNQCQTMQNQFQTMQNHLANLTDMMPKFMSSNTALSSGSGTLPGNTITNPKEDLKGIATRSGVAYQGPTIPTPSKVAKQGTEVTKDQVQTPNSQSTTPVQPTVIQSESETLVSEPVVAPVSALMPNLKPSIPYPSRRDNERRSDLGASINLVPLSVWKGLLLPELTPTCMTLELAYRTESKPIGIAKDVKVKVEVLSFSDVTTSGSPTPFDDPIVSTTSPTLTPFGDSDFLLFEEADAFLSLEDDPDSSELDPSYYDPKGDILLLEAILNSDPSPPLPNHEQSVPSFKNELKACEAKTIKSSIDEPPEVELKDLPPHLEYAFLEGENKLPVIIAKELGDKEKSALIKVLKSHKRAIAWKLSDIQGINPEFCTHKILMEEVYKPAV
nr:reverse transcriptase domain-containing protein [Tanacetum cinerariifolium]